MQAQCSTEKVMYSLTGAMCNGLAFDELLSQTGLHQEHLETLLRNLRKGKKVKTLYSRWYLYTVMPAQQITEADQFILKRRKKVLKDNAKTLGEAINHHKAAASHLNRLLQEQITQIQVERLEVPPRIKMHEVYSGPRKVIWDETQREAYRKSLKQAQEAI